MIDFKSEIKNVQPINIRGMESNQYSLNIKTKKSIILYNKAISEIKSDDFDLAIKDLKKALSFNQGFSEAIKLLGLCYVNKKEYGKANSFFKKLAEYDLYRDLAKDYIKNMIIEKSVTKAMDAIRKNDTISDSQEEKSILFKALNRKLIIVLSILVVVAAGLTALYLNRTSLNTISKRDLPTNQVSSSKILTDNNPQQDTTAADQNTVSDQDYKNLQKELTTTKTELDSYKAKYDTLVMLDQIDKSLKNGNYEEAANKLLILKSIRLDDESKLKFDKLWADLKANGFWIIYNQGNKLYKEKKFKEAMPKLIIAFQLEPSADLMPWILCQIGDCYKETNDNVNALAFYKKVKESYPNSKYVSYAEVIINQIENKKN